MRFWLRLEVGGATSGAAPTIIPSKSASSVDKANTPIEQLTLAQKEWNNVPYTLQFTYKDTTYKVFPDGNVKYFEEGEIKTSTIINFDNNRIKIYENKFNAHYDTYVVTKDGHFEKIPIRTPSVKEFYDAPRSIDWRATVEGKEEDYRTQYRIIDGRVWYIEKNSNGQDEVKQSNSIRVEMIDSIERIFIRGVEQKIDTKNGNQLVPAEFYEWEKNGAKIFYYEAKVDGKYEGFRTKYIISPNGEICYFESGEISDRTVSINIILILY